MDETTLTIKITKMGKRRIINLPKILYRDFPAGTLVEIHMRKANGGEK